APADAQCCASPANGTEANGAEPNINLYPELMPARYRIRQQNLAATSPASVDQSRLFSHRLRHLGSLVRSPYHHASAADRRVHLLEIPPPTSSAVRSLLLLASQPCMPLMRYGTGQSCRQ